jgi:hypothetical protein
VATYCRSDITALSNRLEARADSVLRDQMETAKDMKAAALLLRLMLQLSDVEKVETTVGGAKGH